MSKQQTAAHVLPAWFEFIRRHVVLTLLIVGEFIINMGLVIRLVTHDYSHPETWNWYEWVSAGILGPAVGFAAAGVAVSLSQAMADAFTQGRWFKGLNLLGGILLFAAIEVWGSLVERSADAAASPLDIQVISALGVRGTPVTVSALAFALFVPLSAIFFGFTNKPKTLESDEEWQAKAHRRLEEAKLQAQMRQVRVTGLVGAARGAALAAAGKPALPPEAAPVSQEEEAASIGEKAPPSTPVKKSNGLYWTGKDYREYVATQLGRIISLDEATERVRNHPKAKQLADRVGKPWGLHRSSAKSDADRRYASEEMTG